MGHIINNNDTNKNNFSIPSLIISNSNKKLRYSGKRKGALRIQKTDPELVLNYEDIKNILMRSGIEIVKIVSPGFGGSKSGKYDTWYCTYKNNDFNVVFGDGRNAGHVYEDTVVDQLITAHKNNDINHALFKALLAAFNIKGSDIRKIKKVASKGVKRSINEDILNIGEIISDIDIIKTNEEVIHISLKNKHGNTFANIGYNGGFVVNKLNNKEIVEIGSHKLDDLIVKGFGIDKQKVVDGLNYYINQKNIDWSYFEIKPKYNKRKILRYLGSAYGYGYWYVRPEKNQIFELRSVNDVINQIGDIKSVVVTYPYFLKENGLVKKSKQITIKIETTNSNYMIEIRNSHGDINPNEIKIKIL